MALPPILPKLTFMLWLPAVTTMLILTPVLRPRVATRLTELMNKVVAQVGFKLRQRNNTELILLIQLVQRHNPMRQATQFVLHPSQWHRWDALMEA